MSSSGPRPIRVENLSRHGLYLRASNAADSGGHLDLTIELGEGHVSVGAEIVRIDENRGGDSGVGVRFSTVEPPARRMLANYMIAQHYRPHA